SIGVAARRISTRPRIVPGRAASTRPGDKDTEEKTEDTKAAAHRSAARTACALCVLCSFLCVLDEFVIRTKTQVAWCRASLVAAGRRRRACCAAATASAADYAGWSSRRRFR